MEQKKLNKPNTLFYLPSLNRFVDDEWYVIHNLKPLFDTWQLAQCRRNMEDTLMTDRNGDTWWLYYLNEDEENEILELIGWNESYDIKMDRNEIRRLKNERYT